MPSPNRVTRFRRAYQEPQFLFDARRPMSAPTAQMIDQVITHADIAVRMAGERLKLRLSAGMIDELQAQGKLGADAARLADLTVVWDEREGQVITVRDDARLRDAAQRWADWDSLWDEESFAPEPLRHSAAA
ncbi:MAG: hypothetical protein V4514_13080 [Pseudomonadota bacterium]|uniref:hypothetical protein n=1 Tax=unclassified Phenylobacterium TaxID=2640670 RepID=UPI00071567E9|nr:MULTISPECIES: hypothetical protein [unclassified Phenylobacterium]KRB52418.1 hypothetical protein ASE02_12120 [Phenylobacterium sp. Root700]MBT9473807.1 hypothetical protein [Phenylobacterium sp.]